MTLAAQRRVFSIVVLVTLALVAFFGVVVARPTLIGGLAGDPSGGHIGEHFRQPHHRIHDLAFGLLLGTTALGMLAQVRAPAQNVAGQLMAATPILALLLAVLATDPRVLAIPWVAVGASTIVATMLHPYLFRSFGTARPSRRMVVLVAVAAVPLLSFVVSNVGLQRSGSGDHAALGHYGYMAALGLTVIGVGLVSSLRLEGWRLTAWAAGGLAVLLGVVSLVFPDVEGSVSAFGALAAIVWGAGYIAVGEIVRREDRGGGR
jgi:hypothetical protein